VNFTRRVLFKRKTKYPRFNIFIILEKEINKILLHILRVEENFYHEILGVGSSRHIPSRFFYPNKIITTQ